MPRAVERLGALQAQYSPSPYVALWSRLDGFVHDDLTRALERRQIVKATLMRVTLHLLSARDYLALAPVWLASRQETLARRGAPVDLEQLHKRVRDRGELSAEELRDLVWPEVREHVQGAMDSWSATRSLVPTVHLPPSGVWRHHGPARLTHVENWLRRPLGDPHAGAKLLVRRYLAAFGPASQDDLLRFTGLRRVADVRPALDALAPQLRRFRDERGRLLLDLPRAPRPAAATPAPVRFLAKWDSAILGFDDRTRILPGEYHDAVIARNGDVRSTFLVDGFVAGCWREEDRRVTLEPFAPLPLRVRRELEDEAQRLAAFVRT